MTGSLPGDLVTVGKVGKAHGLQGAFFVEGASEDPRRFARGAEVLIDGVPVKVLDTKHGAAGRLVIRVDGPAPRGAPIQIPRSQLPPAEDGSFYVFELIGLPVEEEGGRPLGTVREVLPNIANDVLELDTGVLLPLVEDCILEVDVAGRRIVVAPGYAEPD